MMIRVEGVFKNEGGKKKQWKIKMCGVLWQGAREREGGGGFKDRGDEMCDMR